MRDNDLEWLLRALGKYPPEERGGWTRELKRLGEIPETYLALKVKRRRVKAGGKFEFTPEVMILLSSGRLHRSGDCFS
jgi:hypothetical protein